MSGDMAATIIPKSDQLNSDDLIVGPMTIKITGVTIRGGGEQPIAISFEGDNGKPYKACKSMCRVMVTAWGPDSKKYAGRSMTLYRDASVKWGGMEVGGIRISHMSDIASPITMALTATKGNKRPFTVKPLAKAQEAETQADAPTGELITDTQCADLVALLGEVPNGEARFKKQAKIERLTMLPASEFARAVKWAEQARAGA